MHWCRQIWNRKIVPKHGFVIWLAIQDRRQTKSRLMRFGITNKTRCVLCDEQLETGEHLYFECDWTKECLSRVNEWLECQIRSGNLEVMLRRIQRSRTLSKFWKEIYLASIAALVYSIWIARNSKIWQDKQIEVEAIVAQVKYNVKNRFTMTNCTKGKGIDQEWYSLL